MKRLAAILFAGGALWLFLAAGTVFADNGPHLQRSGGLTADSCAGCHRAHTAGSAMLTIDPQPALCYDCHGAAAAGSTTRVENGTGTGSNAGALRGGGVQFALVDSGNPSRIGFGPGNGSVPALATGATTTSHHAVDFSDQVIWGNGPISGVTPNAGKQTELRCGSCHNPHGERTYRILRATPVDSGVTTAQRVYVTDVTDWQPPAPTSLTANQAVTVGPGGPGTYGYATTNYWRPQDPNWKGSDFVLQGDTINGTTGAITLGQDSKDFLGATSKWCATCHTRYMANSGDYEVNSGDKVFAFRHPVWGTSSATDTANASTSAPACLQCHLAHGSNAAMGSNSASVSEPGSNTVPAETSRLLRVNSRGVCQMCHFK